LQYDKKKHFEPLGNDYLKHDTREKIEREISFIRCPLLEAGVNTEEAGSTNLLTNLNDWIVEDSAPADSAPPDSAPATTTALPDSLPRTAATPLDSVPAMTAAPPDSAPTMTVAPTDSAPAITETTLENLAMFELDDLATLEVDDAPSTKEDNVASRLPFGAAESEPANKKARMDFGFGAQRWGNRLGGNQVWTMHNTYIHSKDLEGRQHEASFMLYQHITWVDGSILPPKELYMRVANHFNIWHIGLVGKDGYGYGGKIGEKVVEQCFKEEGRLILQGSLGGHVIPQATASGHLGMLIPQHVPLEGGGDEACVLSVNSCLQHKAIPHWHGD
jgi:hypothetical protein